MTKLLLAGGWLAIVVGAIFYYRSAGCNPEAFTIGETHAVACRVKADCVELDFPDGMMVVMKFAEGNPFSGQSREPCILENPMDEAKTPSVEKLKPTRQNKSHAAAAAPRIASAVVVNAPPGSVPVVIQR